MIEIEHLCKNFGGLAAVRDISLSVPPGELFCFLGPNGAGKTTTIKMLTGLLRPTSGVARICGFDIQQHPIEAKKLIGYIPDMPFMYDRLTTTEFFQFIGELYRIPRDAVARELEASFQLFGLTDYRRELVKDLSHGFRQRLIYAATFLHEPRVLFVDEPLIGLDPYTIRMLKDLLRTKARAGMTIFLTTHILALAEDIADRIGVIMNGQLATLGTVADLMALGGGDNLEDAFLNMTAPESPRRLAGSEPTPPRKD